MEIPTEEEVRAFPVTVDLPTAGRCFGVGRTVAYELARAGKFPCQVLPVGRRYKVTKTALLIALGYDTDMSERDTGEQEAA